MRVLHEAYRARVGGGHPIEPGEAGQERPTGAPTEKVVAARPTIDVEGSIVAAYHEHVARLRSFAFGATRREDVAEEIVQEAFLRLVTELRSGRSPENVGGWLYRVCANLVISRARRRSVVDRLLVMARLGGGVPSPEDVALGRERNQMLTAALGKLPADARVALLLESRGFSAIEIGEVLGRTPNATRSYICRQRVRLRDELANLGMGES